MPNIHFFLPESFKDKVFGEHITYYSWDTYHKHLCKSNLHITHGGINSIKDSLANGVPMLILPLDWKSDQIHNALIFEHPGLAKVWNLKHGTIEDVKRNIEAYLEENYYKKSRNMWQSTERSINLKMREQNSWS